MDKVEPTNSTSTPKTDNRRTTNERLSVSRLPTAYRIQNTNPVEDSKTEQMSPSPSSSSDSDFSESEALAMMNVELRHEMHHTQSFLEDKWAKLQKKLKKEKKAKKHKRDKSKSKEHDSAEKGAKRKRENTPEKDERPVKTARIESKHEKATHENSDRHRERHSKSSSSLQCDSDGRDKRESRRSDASSSRDRDRRDDSSRRDRRDDRRRDDDSSRRSYNSGRQPFYRGDGDSRSNNDEYRGRGSGGNRHEERDRRRDERPERERSPPNLAPNVRSREEHHRPAYLTDKVLEHAEVIQRRKLLWQKGRIDHAKRKTDEITTTSHEMDKVKPQQSTSPEPSTSRAEQKWAQLISTCDPSQPATEKFKKLLGIREPIGPQTKQSNAMDVDLAAAEERRRQDYVFSALDAQFAQATTTGYIKRGTGLGFGSYSADTLDRLLQQHRSSTQ